MEACTHIMKRSLLKNYYEMLSLRGGKMKNIRDKVIKVLDDLKAKYPEQKIIVETPSGTVNLKIGDALIYEGMRGEIVIDSE